MIFFRHFFSKDSLIKCVIPFTIPFNISPYLEYYVQTGATTLIHDIAKLENVQEFAKVMWHLRFPELLGRVRHFSLHRKRLHSDLIETLKSLRGFDSVDPRKICSPRK